MSTLPSPNNMPAGFVGNGPAMPPRPPSNDVTDPPYRPAAPMADIVSDIPSIWVPRFCGMQSLESRFGPNARRIIYERLKNSPTYDDDIDGDQDSYSSSDEEDSDDSLEADHADSPQTAQAIDALLHVSNTYNTGAIQGGVQGGIQGGTQGGFQGVFQGSLQGGVQGFIANYFGASTAPPGVIVPPEPSEISGRPYPASQLLHDFRPYGNPNVSHPIWPNPHADFPHLDLSAELHLLHQIHPPPPPPSALPFFNSFEPGPNTALHPPPLAAALVNRTKDPKPLHGPVIPRIARARINLTALSQHHNLYFAAYQNKIHVYRPESAPEILRGPVLVLSPRPSAAAKVVGGYIDEDFPHQVNHLIVGDLGNEEILLLAYDDGDVIAYYTRHIVQYLQRKLHAEIGQHAHDLNLQAFHAQIAAGTAKKGSSEPRAKGPPFPKKPSPFFHETVGKSAWGLAIHAKSRLIAVSSNLVEVNVFAFALSSSRVGDQKFMMVKNRCTQMYLRTGTYQPSVAESLRLRDRNWRILLPLGSSGHNMPSISFIDDLSGYAEKVVGIDIYGATWLVDIWTVGARSVHYVAPPKQNGQYIGWGILPIPVSAFMNTRKMPEVQPISYTSNSHWLNIGPYLDHAEKNDPRPCKNPDPDLSKLSWGEDYSDDSEDGEEDADDSCAIEEDADDSCAIEEDADDSCAIEEDRYASSGYEYDSNDGSSSEEYDSAMDPYRSGYDFEGGRDTRVFGSDGRGGGYPPYHGPGGGGGGGGGGGSTFRYSENYRTRNDALPRISLDEIWGNRSAEDFQLGTIVCPSLSTIWKECSTKKLLSILRHSWDRQQKVETVMVSTTQRSELFPLSSRYSFLRTFNTSAELFSTNLFRTPSVLFENVLYPPTLANRPWDMGRNYHRISMLAFIPEINLVVAGAMYGRVVLLRLVKDAIQDNIALQGRQGSTQPRPWLFIPHRAIRREWVLPRRAEEKAGLRPSCCMLGLAVSPVPEVGRASMRGLFRGSKRRRHGAGSDDEDDEEDVDHEGDNDYGDLEESDDDDDENNKGKETCDSPERLQRQLRKRQRKEEIRDYEQILKEQRLPQSEYMDKYGHVDDRKRTLPRRWRLLLHYQDHTILQYFIEEDEPGSPKRLKVYAK